MFIKMEQSLNKLKHVRFPPWTEILLEKISVKRVIKENKICRSSTCNVFLYGFFYWLVSMYPVTYCMISFLLCLDFFLKRKNNYEMKCIFWPSDDVVQKTEKEGCHLVPKPSTKDLYLFIYALTLKVFFQKFIFKNDSINIFWL